MVGTQRLQSLPLRFQRRETLTPIYGFAAVTMSTPPNQTLRLVQWGVQRGYFITTKDFVLEMSTEEAIGAIRITLLFDCFCVYHLFSNC